MTEATDKRELRSSMRAALKAAAPEDRRRWDAAIVKGIQAELAGFRGLKAVCLYHPRSDEIDLEPLRDSLLAAGVRLVYPKVEPGQEDLALYFVDDPARQLVAGAYGLWEPAAGQCEAAAACDADVYIVPGLAFDRKGGRLGRGKGYYDRLLAQCANATFLAGCYQLQVVENVPVTQHDIRMDILLTESETLQLTK